VTGKARLLTVDSDMLRACIAAGLGSTIVISVQTVRYDTIVEFNEL